MATTLIGQLATADGHTEHHLLDGSLDQLYKLPAANFRAIQPRPMPVYLSHDTTVAPLGQVVHLERTGALMAVAVLDGIDVTDLLADGDWYLSAGATARRTGRLLEYGDAVVNEVSLTRTPAACGTAPICWSSGDLTKGTCGAPSTLPLFWHDSWANAAAQADNYAYRRAAPNSLWVFDRVPAYARPAPPVTRAAVEPAAIVHRRAAATPRRPLITWFGTPIYDRAVADELIDIFERRQQQEREATW